MTDKLMTAADAGLLSCHNCSLLSKAGSGQHADLICPRCDAVLHKRKPNSIARTWAFVIAAFICYIPANLLPMTVVTSLGNVESDTIMSGVIYFMQHGEWPIGLVILIASVVVPLTKLFILIYLLISLQRKSQWRPAERTRLYRITEAIGRWSMTDIYVVTVMVALVHLGNLATIEAGVGAIFFGAVVVLTIIAALTFDPREIWDNMESSK
ncbi:MAG: paraquat-inducible protein A [Gammaproteobacteria bacterium]|jgi:paraquat-inducible protein A|nr:paraquat-inducible protein A [Gammaproteobacteria bacterium]